MRILFHFQRISLVTLYIAACLRLSCADSGSEDEMSHYLYDEDADPVIDYHGEREEDIMKPSFLYGETNGPRMVEFYAYWCPHCRHFRDHYVQLARQITTVASDQDVGISVHAISCTEYHAICEDFNIGGYPKIKLFPANSTTPTNVNYWEAHPFEILRDLGIHPTGPLKFETPPETKTKTRAKTEKAIVRRSKSDVFHDAHLSFHFSLRNSIYMSVGPLSNKTKDAFYDWLMLLQQSLPPTWEIQNLVDALVKDYDEIVKSEDNLLKVVNRFPPPTDKWSESCTKGEKGMGFTCGLWELFHIITVGVVEYNLMIYDGDHLIMPVDHVAVTLRNYIEHFFGCEVCRTNFIHEYESCAHDRCSRLHKGATTQRQWAELPLWLFETHNSVNVRLMRERAEREKWSPTRDDEIKAEWPSRDECPKCWREDGAWDEEMVYRFLRVQYWLDDAVAGVYRKQLAESEDDDDDEAHMPSIALQFVPIIIVLGMGVAWYVKEKERRKTGLHKRIA